MTTAEHQGPDNGGREFSTEAELETVYKRLTDELWSSFSRASLPVELFSSLRVPKELTDARTNAAMELLAAEEHFAALHASCKEYLIRRYGSLRPLKDFEDCAWTMGSAEAALALLRGADAFIVDHPVDYPGMWGVSGAPGKIAVAILRHKMNTPGIDGHYIDVATLANCAGNPGFTNEQRALLTTYLDTIKE